MTPFGWQLREAHFRFGDGVVNLNHGSYGVPPNQVVEARIAAIRQELEFPDKYIRLNHDSIALETRSILAKVLDADVDNVVLTVNATMAINAVLRSYPFPPGAKILKFSTIYGSCDNTLKMVAEKYGLRPIEVCLDLPISQEGIVHVLEAALDEHPDATMAMFDTVSSMPAIRFPWEELVALCRKRGVLSLVDGAHGIGLIPISLRSARPDFFTTNAHKWFLASHSCAVLYVDPAHHRKINSLPVSANYFSMKEDLGHEGNRTALSRTFVYVGTADHSAVQSVKEAAKFRLDVLGGEEVILDYQRSLSKQASEFLCRELGTTEVGDYGYNERTALITLLYPLQPSSTSEQVELANWTNNHMMNTWKTIMPLAAYRGNVYFRISAAPYVDMHDIQYGAKVVKESINAWKKHKAETNRNYEI